MEIAIGKVLCESVSNKLDLWNFSSYFHGTCKLERVLIGKNVS